MSGRGVVLCFPGCINVRVPPRIMAKDLYGTPQSNSCAPLPELLYSVVQLHRLPIYTSERIFELRVLEKSNFLPLSAICQDSNV
jgi:hypothetical protein